jgi:hypothetical protein
MVAVVQKMPSTIPVSPDASYIWRFPLPNRVGSEYSETRILHVDFKQAGWIAGAFLVIWWGFFFSTVSAFSVGYKEIDVGRWIERINPKQETLRATGWLRTISGVQSLLSFYLLVLWFLIYFGRPFE